jgi:hypothetical protein
MPSQVYGGKTVRCLFHYTDNFNYQTLFQLKTSLYEKNNVNCIDYCSVLHGLQSNDQV